MVWVLCGVGWLIGVCGGVGGAEGLVRRARAAENLEGLLNTLSSHWVRFGPMYNAAKHGFAVGAKEDHVKMSAEQLTMETAGPAIQYLDYKKSDGRWMEATTFVDSPRSLALTSLAVLTLRSLWTVARSRYTDDDSPVETFQMQKPITEVFGDSTPSESSIRTVRSILPDDQRGEGGRRKGMGAGNRHRPLDHLTYGLRGASGHHRRLPSHATSATTLNGIPSGLVTFETWGLSAPVRTSPSPSNS